MSDLEKLGELETEKRNPRSSNLDAMSSLEIAGLMNDEDKKTALCVEKNLELIAKFADRIAVSISTGGRCFYIGAGTSGRLAVIDAAETVPTFNIPHGTFTAILAGGPDAMVRSLEKTEDDAETGASELEKYKISRKDVVIGVSASGRTPFVVGALEKAIECGAFTGCIVNVRNSKLSKMVEIPIEAISGPEIVTGSTRLKAGTADKMVLNMLSTISMVRLGKVYMNFMVDVMPINEKLVERSVLMIVDASGVSKKEAVKLLEEAGMNPKTAIVMAITGKTLKECEKLLRENGGIVRKAISR